MPRGFPDDAPEAEAAYAHLVSPLHGRRSGKPLAAYQRELVRTLLPRLAVDVAGAIDPRGLFPEACRDIWLEIGFGGGEHLLSAAGHHRDVGIIGCEPFLNGMARALADLAGLDLDNVRLHCGDAGELIDQLPDASLGRVFLFYPDPWPKRRQRKRRFVSDLMLSRLARAMKSGAELRFATDIDDKNGWTLARLLRSPDFIWTAERAGDWQIPWPDWVSTRYEQKAIREGRRPCYITAVRR
jgi:tRNA (guanine-N7-)-methyltransferase